MKMLLIMTVVFLFASCGHEYENTAEQKRLLELRKNQPLDTLTAIFTSSTGSLDLYIKDGRLTLPPDIKAKLSDTPTRDIKVCGNFPKDMIDPTSRNYNPDLAYHIVGKVIAADTNNAVGTVPLFYVTEWLKVDK